MSELWECGCERMNERYSGVREIAGSVCLPRLLRVPLCACWSSEFWRTKVGGVWCTNLAVKW